MHQEASASIETAKTAQRVNDAAFTPEQLSSGAERCTVHACNLNCVAPPLNRPRFQALRRNGTAIVGRSAQYIEDALAIMRADPEVASIVRSDGVAMAVRKARSYLPPVDFAGTWAVGSMLPLNWGGT